MTQLRQQRTLKSPCSVSGRGYWTGESSTLTFLPAEPTTGIVFEVDRVSVPATTENSTGMSLRTRLGTPPMHLDMIEHVMAALYGLRIDNCRIRCSGTEMPGLDGSSLALALALNSAGFKTQPDYRETLVIDRPIRVSDGDRWIEATPVVDGSYTLKYTLDYGPDSPIPAGSHECRLTPQTFSSELAPARTFVTDAEANALQSSGLAQHVTYQDLVVFGSNGPIDNSLRFDNECARHKTLDLVGDLALSGVDLVGRVEAHKSGHQLNAQMAKKLRELALAARENTTDQVRRAA
ncbi:MAG TPA: UDP-3-O-[3-hydroxymyristoyl] N-acetylglucosamine deacetylase [Planctomycetaceae bacterium]|nr:UDP-3-O-[3-hydroxymyristoyl] N-acetylglucosamine deacetylase [Planctomycetaceae bacterium]